MDEMTSMRLQPLREVLDFLDRTSVPTPETLAARAAAGALVRVRSLLRAIVVLVESPGVSITEIDVLVRVLLEMAITMAWIGTDEERAAQYRDDGVRAAKVWRRQMEQHGTTFGPPTREAFDAYVAEGQDRDPLPSVEQRAINRRPDGEPAQGWSLHREYDFIYRRLSAAVHHDHRLQALVEPLLGRGALALTSSAARMALGVLLSSVCEPLNMPSAWVKGMRLVVGT